MHHYLKRLMSLKKFQEGQIRLSVRVFQHMVEIPYWLVVMDRKDQVEFRCGQKNPSFRGAGSDSQEEIIPYLKGGFSQTAPQFAENLSPARRFCQITLQTVDAP